MYIYIYMCVCVCVCVCVGACACVCVCVCISLFISIYKTTAVRPFMNPLEKQQSKKNMTYGALLEN